MADETFDKICEKWGGKRITNTKLVTPQGVLDLTRDSEKTIKSAAADAWFGVLLRDESRGQSGDDWKSLQPVIQAMAMAMARHTRGPSTQRRSILLEN